MEKLIRVLEGITATLWAITILYSIFFFSLGGFLLNDIFQEILIGLITGAISSLVFTSISYFAFLHKIPEKTYEKISIDRNVIVRRMDNSLFTTLLYI